MTILIGDCIYPEFIPKFNYLFLAVGSIEMAQVVSIYRKLYTSHYYMDY